MIRNRIFLSALAAVAVSAGVLVADRYSLFGITRQEQSGFIDAQFKTVDTVSGLPISDVHVRCFQRMNENACGQRDSREAGMVYIKIPVRRVVSRSLFFKQGEIMAKTLDPQLHIMFIHPDYETPVQTFELAEFYANPGRQTLVQLLPRQGDPSTRE